MPGKPKAEDVEAARERRYILADILNTNLLSPEARKEFERQYEETGRILTEAVASTTA